MSKNLYDELNKTLEKGLSGGSVSAATVTFAQKTVLSSIKLYDEMVVRPTVKALEDELKELNLI